MLLTTIYGVLFGSIPVVAALLLVPFGLIRKPDRNDLLWWGAAIIIIIAEGVHGEVSTFGLSIMVAYLLWRAGRHLASRPYARTMAPHLVTGILIALALASGSALFQLLFLSESRATSWPWPVHPNLFGHQLLALIALVPMVDERPAWRIGAVLLGAPALALSGSRAAILGLVVLILYLLLTVREPRWRAIVLTGVVLTTLLIISLTPLRVRLASALQLVSGSAAISGSVPTNLFRASELLDSDVWQQARISVTAQTEGEPIEWLLAKRGTGRQPGLRQPVLLRPGADYTLSGEFRPNDPASEYGLFGQSQGEGLFLSVLIRSEHWEGEVRGALNLLNVNFTSLEDAWYRIEANFHYLGTDAAALRVGPVVDWRSSMHDSELGVRALQFELGSVATPYQSTNLYDWARVGSRQSAVGRILMWQAGRDGFLARPLSGWGKGAFGEYYGSRLPDSEIPTTLPGHAHNLVLALAFENGILGLLGLIALLAALAIPAGRTLDTVVIVSLAAILLANLFDNTLIYTGVLYPIAVAVGWRVKKVVSSHLPNL